MVHRIHSHDTFSMKMISAAAVLVAVIFMLYLVRQPIAGPPAISKSPGGGISPDEAVTGKSVSSVYVREVYQNVTCVIPLNDTWNLISSPCASSNKTMGYSVISIRDDFISAHIYNTSQSNDTWKSYNPNIENFSVQDLTVFAIEKGYWVNVNASVNLTQTGNITLPNFIYLEKGWNLFGWTSNETKNITVALVSIKGKYTAVHAYFANDSVDPWKVYNPTLDYSMSDLKYMIPYHGYWINMTTNATLKVI
jgi:hypothetical protein